MFGKIIMKKRTFCARRQRQNVQQFVRSPDKPETANLPDPDQLFFKLYHLSHLFLDSISANIILMMLAILHFQELANITFV